jgi:transcriptional antiterminator RfaH
MDPRWFCCKCKPRQEAKAAENLHRQDFETYHPQITIERIRNGKIGTIRESLFPSYLLVKFTLSDAAWRSINSTRGVLGLLAFGENARPSPMPVGEVEQIQAREKKGLLFISEVKRVRRGDRVRIKIGPAADQIGTVLFTRAERVQLLLNLLGRQTRVYAPLHVLEVVSQHKMLGPPLVRKPLPF